MSPIDGSGNGDLAGYGFHGNGGGPWAEYGNGDGHGYGFHGDGSGGGDWHDEGCGHGHGDGDDYELLGTATILVGAE